MADSVRVSFQGELGAFSEEAVHLLVPGAEPVGLPSFDAAVSAVIDGSVGAGVIPVENTLAGTVAAAYDALAASPIDVIGEVAIPIRHCLLALPGATLDQLNEAQSHPVALAQCRGFFDRNARLTEQVVYDTAGAAKAVAEAGDPTVAAIASRAAGARYGLEVLESDLQDRDDNQTRFFLVRSTAPAGEEFVADASEGADPSLKSAWVVEVPNRPGSLYELLGVFADRGLDLTHVASRPAPTPWTYRFILEFRHDDASSADEAFEEARLNGATVTVLGSFQTRKP